MGSGYSAIICERRLLYTLLSVFRKFVKSNLIIKGMKSYGWVDDLTGRRGLILGR